MSLTLVPDNAPNYQALSSDIVGGKIVGANTIGASIYITDTKQWYQILPDLTLIELFYNVNSSGSSSGINISAGENHIGETGSYVNQASLEITCPSGSAAYLGGDVISGGSAVVTPYELSNLFRADGVGAFITRLSVLTNVSSQTTRIRIKFYNSGSASVAGDNFPDKEIYTESGYMLGYNDMPAMASSADVSGSCSRTLDNTLRIPVIPAVDSRSLFFSLSTLDPYNSIANQKYTVKAVISE